MTARVVKIRRAKEAEPRWSDEAVAHACASGDPTAVAELFDRFHGPVTRFLSRVVGPGADAEDLLQATFMELARGNARFDGRSAVSTWLIGIASNVARHHLRSKTRRARLIRAVGWAAQKQTADSPEAAVSARWALNRARDVLESLSPDVRQAFVLCEIEGLSAREAAKVLDSTETAIWKRVSDARRAIRRAAKEEAP